MVREGLPKEVELTEERRNGPCAKVAWGYREDLKDGRCGWYASLRIRTAAWRGCKSTGFRSPTDLVQPSWVTWVASFNLSGPQLPPLEGCGGD